MAKKASVQIDVDQLTEEQADLFQDELIEMINQQSSEISTEESIEFNSIKIEEEH